MSLQLSSYEVNDPTFINDLKLSDTHVSKVKVWLETFGYYVVKPDIRVRDKVENMSEFSDEGDLFIVEGDTRHRIEVKRRLINFSNIHPFPYKTIIVDVAHCWERADPKPLMYILTNKDDTWCYVVTKNTANEWIKTSRWDTKKKRNRNFFECPIHLVKLFSFQYSRGRMD